MPLLPARHLTSNDFLDGPQLACRASDLLLPLLQPAFLFTIDTLTRFVQQAKGPARAARKGSLGALDGFLRGGDLSCEAGGEGKGEEERYGRAVVEEERAVIRCVGGCGWRKEDISVHLQGGDVG